MSNYLSKIAVRSGDLKQGGQKTGFISSAMRATDDITDIIQKEPAPNGHGFPAGEITPGSPRDPFLNTASQIENPAHDFQTTSPVGPTGQNRPSSYLNDLAARNQTAGTFVESRGNSIKAADDITMHSPDSSNPEIKESADQKAEVPVFKATIQPAEIAGKQVREKKKDEGGADDFFTEVKTSENPSKKTDPNQPQRIEPRQKEELPVIKILEKATQAFNPVENKVAAKPANKNNSQKLVIGKITVEVLPSRPEPVKQQQNVSRRVVNNGNNKANPTHKLSYGLGQL